MAQKPDKQKVRGTLRRAKKTTDSQSRTLVTENNDDGTQIENNVKKPKTKVGGTKTAATESEGYKREMKDFVTNCVTTGVTALASEFAQTRVSTYLGYCIGFISYFTYQLVF